MSLLVIALVLALALPAQSAYPKPWPKGLSPYFYNTSCPEAGAIVAARVNFYFKKDPNVAGSLLRLLFHDCFVQGCDGSVLLDGLTAEKMAGPNFRSLAAFNVVEDIKAHLEKACPGIVSCADILALGARQAVLESGGPFIPTVLGRRDARTSSAILAQQFLPGFTMSTSQLIANFAAVGLNTTDMVTLSGGHTIGRGHCSKVQDRLHPRDDPRLNKPFAASLHQHCDPPKGTPMTFLTMDQKSRVAFDNHYYKNILQGTALLTSDANLGSDKRTLPLVKLFASNQQAFFNAFVASMQKMSARNVLTGTHGEIRRQCTYVNRK